MSTRKYFITATMRLNPIWTTPSLMGLKLVRNVDDVERLTSPYLQPHDRHAALIQLAEKGGEYGFMLLYLCICATSEESRGHANAARILTDVGRYVVGVSQYRKVD